METVKYENVLMFLENKADTLENNVALGMKTHLGWEELTYRGLSILAKRLANYLISIGIDKGDKLAILSESMPEWGATLFASVMAGATTVPLDIKLTIYELTSILQSCQPKVLVVSTKFLETALELKKIITSIEHIIIMDGSQTNKEYATLYNISDTGDRKWRHRGLSKTAIIIYTSGTTGAPKGVEITFKNIMSQIGAVGKAFHMGTKDRLLSILPMNHLFELTVGFLSFLNMGTSIYYSQSLKPKDVFNILQTKNITFMIVVPAFLKLIKSTIESENSQKSKFAKFYFNLRYEIAKFIPSYLIKKLMFRSIHRKFGGHYKGFLSGGAPLDMEVYNFFHTLGIKVYEGYGLSEASPVVSVNTSRNTRVGSVGRTLYNVEAKVDKHTGELLVRGDNVMKGYYNQPDLTAQVIEKDGWLHTGDIAKIDSDGYIFITGRIKNMIVLSGGKKVFPEEIESVFELSEKLAESCVFGITRKIGQKEGTEDICAVVVPKPEIIERHPNDDDLNKVIREEVKELSKRLSHFKRPVNIVVSKNPLPRTATSKIKRKEVKALVEENKI